MQMKKTILILLAVLLLLGLSGCGARDVANKDSDTDSAQAESGELKYLKTDDEKFFIGEWKAAYLIDNKESKLSRFSEDFLVSFTDTTMTSGGRDSLITLDYAFNGLETNATVTSANITYGDKESGMQTRVKLCLADANGVENIEDGRYMVMIELDQLDKMMLLVKTQ